MGIGNESLYKINDLGYMTIKDDATPIHVYGKSL